MDCIRLKGMYSEFPFPPILFKLISYKYTLDDSCYPHALLLRLWILTNFSLYSQWKLVLGREENAPRANRSVNDLCKPVFTRFALN